MPDAYQWRAIFNPEGTDVLDEETPTEHHTFAEIDQDRLLAFILMPQREGLSAHALHLEPGQRLVFFRRTAIAANGPEANIPRKAHVIGWQQTVRGQSVKSLVAVFDSGATLHTSDESMIEP